MIPLHNFCSLLILILNNFEPVNKQEAQRAREEGERRRRDRDYDRRYRGRDRYRDKYRKHNPRDYMDDYHDEL
ncbi:hypothetical protein JRO89_XS04G0019200 [Xanthoceras sorbifolium]|uniref:Uncharacterized protein n=1 Tax=Xanthoceras sorbifolium TaxID=99658 RepID=A0ABQ8I3V2_9ROSI|nr:hypothetical protein JRO89_XS04G0019200 [Xanthoceras sorbifolium]